MEAYCMRCSAVNLFRFSNVRILHPNLRIRSLASSPVTTRTERSKVYDALLVDAGGTLLQLARPVEETYATIGAKYGLNATNTEIKQGFKRAFAASWPESLRYQHFANGDAWRLPCGAFDIICDLKESGVKLAVVSNFDTRLRKLLKDLNVSHLFDAIIVSAEVGFEKPAPEIFKAALDQIGVVAEKAVHVGDDAKADKMGANAVGIDCWLWGSDVASFAEIRDRIVKPDS